MVLIKLYKCSKYIAVVRKCAQQNYCNDIQQDEYLELEIDIQEEEKKKLMFKKKMKQCII